MRKEEPTPLYAMGFFTMHESGLVDQVIVFDYHDPSHYYWELSKKPGRLDREKRMLLENMQYYLDQEKVLINGEEAPPQVTHVEIGFRGRPELPYIIFLIEFRGELKKGMNSYVNIYEEETAEYDYIVAWLLPESARVIRAELGVPYSIESGGRSLVFRVKRGTRVGGREAIYFKID